MCIQNWYKCSLIPKLHCTIGCTSDDYNDSDSEDDSYSDDDDNDDDYGYYDKDDNNCENENNLMKMIMTLLMLIISNGIIYNSNDNLSLRSTCIHD